MQKIINFSNPIIDSKDALNIVNKVFDNNWPNEGKLTKLFENKIKKILDVKYAVATTSGTAALFLALKSIGIKKNDEVVVPNITFPATANAVKMVGAKVVLVDIDPETLLIDFKSLNNVITKKTKAVIPVHISGRGGNIEKLIKICKIKNIKVVEDAAEAFGSKFKTKSLGTFGECGCFSFAPNKIITTGQGGLVVTNRKKIYEKLKIYKNQGRKGVTTGGEDTYKDWGFNFKFSDMQAALGLSQLKKFNIRKKKLILIYKNYKNNLIQNKNIKMFNFDYKEGELPLWIDIFCLKRNLLFNYLKKNKIICRFYWYPINSIISYKEKKKKIHKFE